MKVNTIWKPPHRPDIAIEDARSRLTRGLWHRRLRSPDGLDAEERHHWMRKQQIDIDQRPIPHWTPTTISIEGTTLHAEVYDEG